MTAFCDYVKFYDLLYADKDYQAESAFVQRLFGQRIQVPADLVEMGCGTGIHASLMAEAGWKVFGVDMAEDMIVAARNRLALVPPVVRDRVTFARADIRNVELGQSFSAAMSLFHVVSYLTTDSDLYAALTSVRRHLVLGGTFVFDFWHAPAILDGGPQRREKIGESHEWLVHRLTQPVWEKDKDMVKVNFHITATNKTTGEVRKLHEEHAMRYFFPDVLMAALKDCGFSVDDCGEWLTGAPVRPDVFGVYIVARAE